MAIQNAVEWTDAPLQLPLYRCWLARKGDSPPRSDGACEFFRAENDDNGEGRLSSLRSSWSMGHADGPLLAPVLRSVAVAVSAQCVN